MKITGIVAFPVRIGHRNQLIVKVETDDGISGWGESGLSGRELAVMGALEHFGRFLVGRDPFAAGALWQEAYRGQYFEGGRVLTAAISAIDIALYDIKGKALGVPVYELLGGKHRDSVPTFATAQGESIDELVADAAALVSLGWNVIRIMAAGHNAPARYEPREHLAESARRAIAVREALGADVVLGLEYHHRLSVAEAASFCQRMPSGTLDFLEEPIRDETPEAYEALRRLTDVPFAIGEEFASKWQALPYIERGIHQYNRIDICNIGGFTESMKVAGWSEAHYVDLMPHNPLGSICTAATIQLAAAVPNFAWAETWERGPYSGGSDDSVFVARPQLDGASFPVGDAPGLGIEIDEERLTALAAKPFESWEPPHLRRDDGSFTNW